ncbi:hypothetical protein [Paenibacillus oralis]|uniref:hypothetical protein n=1 Tax=Paenibacillus oralis TaxID=2490856 RepID=UPI0026A159E5
MALEKKRYYVSVQGRSVLDDPGAAAYEWSVEATSEEADTLKHILDQLGEKEESTFLAYTYPWPDTPEDDVNRSYQSVVSGLFREIYRLGTAETREQLERAGYPGKLWPV